MESMYCKEPTSISNNGSVTSLRSQLHSPWIMGESSNSETHVDNTESSWLALIKEKAVIQYHITLEYSLVWTKEEPIHLDSSVVNHCTVHRSWSVNATKTIVQSMGHGANVPLYNPWTMGLMYCCTIHGP